MSNITWACSGIPRRVWEPVWYRRGTGCIIWLTGPVSPVNSVMPNAECRMPNAECRKLDETFPHFISQMESMLTTGEMNPRHAHCVILYHNGFTCEADTLGSCGYVYIAIYPTQR